MCGLDALFGLSIPVVELLVPAVELFVAPLVPTNVELLVLAAELLVELFDVAASGDATLEIDDVFGSSPQAIRLETHTKKHINFIIGSIPLLNRQHYEGLVGVFQNKKGQQWPKHLISFNFIRP